MTQTGTPYYASPEVWRDMPYNEKSDMWSLGCVLYELLALRPPFRAENMEGLYRKVLRGQYSTVPKHYGNDLADVIGVLLQVNPKHRPSVDQLLQMPFVNRHIRDLPGDMGRRTDLLQTIKLPTSPLDLSHCLPKPRYEENVPKVADDAHPKSDVGQAHPRCRGGSSPPTSLPPLARADREEVAKVAKEGDSLDTLLSARGPPPRHGRDDRSSIASIESGTPRGPRRQVLAPQHLAEPRTGNRALAPYQASPPRPPRDRRSMASHVRNQYLPRDVSSSRAPGGLRLPRLAV